jgi:hypothetical protein
MTVCATLQSVETDVWYTKPFGLRKSPLLKPLWFPHPAGGFEPSARGATRFRFRNKFGMTRGGGVHRALSICNTPLIQPKPLRHPEMFLFRIKTCRQARPHSKHTRFRFQNKFGMTRGGVCIALCRSATPRSSNPSRSLILKCFYSGSKPAVRQGRTVSIHGSDSETSSE